MSATMDMAHRGKLFARVRETCHTDECGISVEANDSANCFCLKISVSKGIAMVLPSLLPWQKIIRNE